MRNDFYFFYFLLYSFKLIIYIMINIEFIIFSIIYLLVFFQVIGFVSKKFDTFTTFSFSCFWTRNKFT